MKKRPSVYSKMGHVDFPIYDDKYADLAYIKPENAGIMTVRLLIEDTSADQKYPIAPGDRPEPDDFLVGCDGFASPKEAHEYFRQPRRIVENLLLGAIDWTGCSLAENALNVVDLWCAKADDLDTEGKTALEKLKAAYDGCLFWIVTSLDNKQKTIEALRHEIETLGYQTETWSRVPQDEITCGECAKDNIVAIKPHVSTKTTGWKKIRKGFWVCRRHNKNAKIYILNDPNSIFEVKA